MITYSFLYYKLYNFTFAQCVRLFFIFFETGTLRFAPEKQKHRSKLLSLRKEIICHGDLAMPTNETVGVRRGTIQNLKNWNVVDCVIYTRL